MPWKQCCTSQPIYMQASAKLQNTKKAQLVQKHNAISLKEAVLKYTDNP